MHDHSYAIYGGGHNDTVGGNTYVTFTGSAQANYLYGGSSGTGNVGITNVTFSGGKVMCLHGGNNNSGTISGVNVTVTGGEMEQLFGANLESSMTGDVSIDLQGGKITRRVYGGCYNEYTGSNCVTGNINLIISSGVNITFDAIDPDTGSLYLDRTISASSRYATTTDEVCTITFVDEAAYTNYNEQCAGYDSIVKSYE